MDVLFSPQVAIAYGWITVSLLIAVIAARLLIPEEKRRRIADTYRGVLRHRTRRPAGEGFG